MHLKGMRFCGAMLLCYFIVIHSCFSQKKHSIAGRIIDERGLPVPFASIQLKEDGTGTLSGENGNFKITVADPHPRTLMISAIGYKKYTAQIDPATSGGDIVILSDQIMLNEVYIFPDSSLRQLLAKAYRSIIQNYPTHPIELNGFFRSYHKSAEDNQYITFTESILKVQEEGYQSAGQDAQVEVVRVRNFRFRQRDQIDNVRYYGSAFIANWNDPVKMREAFLNPSSFNKKFQYQLQKVLQYNQGRDSVYVVQFNSTDKDKTKQGTIWIDKKSLSYKKIEWTDTDPPVGNPLVPIRRLSRRYVTIYEQAEKVSYLKYASIKGSNYNTKTKKEIRFVYDFVTNSHNLSGVLSPIDPTKRISYGTLFAELDNSGDTDFLDEYSTIASDSVFVKSEPIALTIEESDSIKQDLGRSQSGTSTRDKVFKLVRNLSFNYGVSAFFYHKMPAQTFQVTVNGKPDERQRQAPQSPAFVTMQLGISGNLSYRSSISIDFFSSVFKQNLYKQTTFGYMRRFMLKKIGNPINFTAYLGGSFGRSGVSLGDVRNDAGIFLGPQNVGRSARIYLGRKEVSALAGLGLEYKRKRLTYFGELRYRKNLHEQDMIVVQTKKSFLSTKSRTLQYPSQDISVTSENIYKGVFAPSLIVGIRLGLLH